MTEQEAHKGRGPGAPSDSEADAPPALTAAAREGFQESSQVMTTATKKKARDDKQLGIIRKVLTNSVRVELVTGPAAGTEKAFPKDKVTVLCPDSAGRNLPGVILAAGKRPPEVPAEAADAKR